MVGNVQDELAVAVVGAATTVYTTTLKNDPQVPITMFFLRTSVLGTSISMKVEVSSDSGGTWTQVYPAANAAATVITSATAWRRVYFSPYLGTSDTDGATVAAAIYRPPILEHDIRVTVVTVGATTNYSLDQFSNPPGVE
jgi:hypothetical protein